MPKTPKVRRRNSSGCPTFDRCIFLFCYSNVAHEMTTIFLGEVGVLVWSLDSCTALLWDSLRGQLSNSSIVFDQNTPIRNSTNKTRSLFYIIGVWIVATMEEAKSRPITPLLLTRSPKTAVPSTDLMAYPERSDRPAQTVLNWMTDGNILYFRFSQGAHGFFVL